MIRATLALITLAAILSSAAVASADTLYVAPPAPSGPGHPLRLGPDHRAAQPGDLVNVLMNFAVQSTSTNTVKQNKNFNVGIGAGIGNAALSFLRFPTGLTGGTGTSSDLEKNGSNSFTASMMATVTEILPSGALAVTGVQRVIINGQIQDMRVSGLVRPEDIDSTDTVLSTHMANVELRFNGDFQEKNKGLLRRILDVLF